ncbi:hypothetical protein JNK13_00665 [bacterium]|nr:hypothetical protein [bacterium]
MKYLLTIAEELGPLMQLAVQAAAQAGAIIRHGAQAINNVRAKGSPADLVTEIDISANAEIIRVLRDGGVKIHVLSEELSPDWSGDLGSEFWSVDPLDATTAFILRAGSHYPSVMLAYVQEKVAVAAVIHFPLSGEWFIGTLAAGVYRCSDADETVRQVNLQSFGARILNQAWVATNAYPVARHRSWGFSVYEGELGEPGVTRLITNEVPHSGLAMRMFTSGLDVILHDNVSDRIKQAPWDVFPVQCLIEAAGGLVVNLDGKRYDPLKPEPFMVCRNQALLEEILRFRHLLEW